MSSSQTALNSSVNMGAENWNPKSWTSKPIKQDVVYEDAEGVQSALRKLEKLPPLVTTHEVRFLLCFSVGRFAWWSES
ncbi:hypothetical protein BDW66DRAFT_138679, partial [Aspergillus desertorum]